MKVWPAKIHPPNQNPRSVPPLYKHALTHTLTHESTASNATRPLRSGGSDSENISLLEKKGNQQEEEERFVYSTCQANLIRLFDNTFKRASYHLHIPLSLSPIIIPN